MDEWTERQKQILSAVFEELDVDTIKRLHRVAKADERAEYTMAFVRRTASTFAIVAGAVFLMWEKIVALFRWMTS